MVTKPLVKLVATRIPNGTAIVLNVGELPNETSVVAKGADCAMSNVIVTKRFNTVAEPRTSEESISTIIRPLPCSLVFTVRTVSAGKPDGIEAIGLVSKVGSKYSVKLEADSLPIGMISTGTVTCPPGDPPPLATLNERESVVSSDSHVEPPIAPSDCCDRPSAPPPPIFGSSPATYRRA